VCVCVCVWARVCARAYFAVEQWWCSVLRVCTNYQATASDCAAVSIVIHTPTHCAHHT
jgi:hypothetical protein